MRPLTNTVAAIQVRPYPLWYTARNPGGPEGPPLRLLKVRCYDAFVTSHLMRILTAAQMREADRFTIEEIGIPSLVLMENAGRQVVAAMGSGYVEQLAGRVGVLCHRRHKGGVDDFIAHTIL